MNRKHNFSPGPSKLPDEVLARLVEELPSHEGLGYSAIEISHRSPRFLEIYRRAVEGIRDLMKLPENFRVLFVHGGASLQFAMIPYNFLRNGKKGGYLDTGVWSQKALAQAKKIGNAETLASGESLNYRAIPDCSALSAPAEEFAYVHVTSNNTIYGTQFREFPKCAAPLVCDASSDIFTRDFPAERFGLIYGGAQKNLSVSGMGFALIREDFLAEPGEADLDLLMYQTHAASGSMFNTPNTFAIFVAALYCEWLKENGGVDAFARESAEKAETIYRAIDASGFYRNDVTPPHRSRVNAVFRLAEEKLEPEFLAEAEREGLCFLKGHRAVGGLRASLYNSVRPASARALADFMKHFERRKG